MQIAAEMKFQADKASEQSSLAAMPGSESWRLLEVGDKIEIGDQYLEYDCQTWKAICVHERCIGDNYSNVFVPMRRMIQNSKI